MPIGCHYAREHVHTPLLHLGNGWTDCAQICYVSRPEYGMDWVETIQSSSNPRATDPNPVQSCWWSRIWIQSSPIRTQQSRYLPNTLQNRDVKANDDVDDDVYSWRFEGRTSDVRVTIRRNCIKSLNMGYTLHISGSSLVRNPLSWWISDPVQSKSAWTGLDYESSGLIQSIPYSGADSDLGLRPIWYVASTKQWGVSARAQLHTPPLFRVLA